MTDLESPMTDWARAMTDLEFPMTNLII